jgi:drug/metabolite transporter (DMT)-like permease
LAHHGLVAAGLSEDTARWLGFLLVGAIVALVGWSLLAKAKKNLTAANLKPAATAASLRETKQWAQNKINPAHHEPAH